MTVTGKHVTFSIEPSTLGVYDYTLTGAAAPDRMVTAPTGVFAGKVPALTAAQRSGTRLQDLQVRDDTLVAIFGTSAGKVKAQAKDAPQGGIFQMEPEFAGNVEFTHVLGPTLFYFVNPFTGKVNFGHGVDAVTTGRAPDAAGQGQPAGRHQARADRYDDPLVGRLGRAHGGRAR